MTDLIQQRSKTHGDFIQGAEIFASEMRQVAQKWLDGHLDNCQFYALTMQSAKRTRILGGNPHFADHWEDLANYATLGGRLNLTDEEDLTEEEEALAVALPVVNFTKA